MSRMGLSLKSSKSRSRQKMTQIAKNKTFQVWRTGVTARIISFRCRGIVSFACMTMEMSTARVKKSTLWRIGIRMQSTMLHSSQRINFLRQQATTDMYQLRIWRQENRRVCSRQISKFPSLRSKFAASLTVTTVLSRLILTDISTFMQFFPRTGDKNRVLF